MGQGVRAQLRSQPDREPQLARMIPNVACLSLRCVDSTRMRWHQVLSGRDAPQLFARSVLMTRKGRSVKRGDRSRLPRRTSHRSADAFAVLLRFLLLRAAGQFRDMRQGYSENPPFWQEMHASSIMAFVATVPSRRVEEWYSLQ